MERDSLATAVVVLVNIMASPWQKNSETKSRPLHEWAAATTTRRV